jgi:hypothetical protein
MAIIEGVEDVHGQLAANVRQPPLVNGEAVLA